MGLEAVYFIGAVVLLAAIIYAVAASRHRNRTVDPIRDEARRAQYRDDQGKAERAAQRATPSAANSNRPVSDAVERPLTEDDLQRAQFGPRGVKGAPDPARMTPQRAKKTPKHVDKGHVS
jgi:hypothetical protein